MAEGKPVGVSESKVFDDEMQKQRNRAAAIYKKITGKTLNPDDGWLGQLHDAMLDARDRGTLSDANAKAYRKQLGLE